MVVDPLIPWITTPGCSPHEELNRSDQHPIPRADRSSAKAIWYRRIDSAYLSHDCGLLNAARWAQAALGLVDRALKADAVAIGVDQHAGLGMKQRSLPAWEIRPIRSSFR